MARPIEPCRDGGLVQDRVTRLPLGKVRTLGGNCLYYLKQVQSEPGRLASAPRITLPTGNYWKLHNKKTDHIARTHMMREGSVLTLPQEKHVQTTPAGKMMWFDGQAAQFDDSAGLTPVAGRTIAEAILKLGGCTRDDIILDVGAGTGTIGVYLADLRSRYLGLDRSRPMLEIFRRKLAARPQPILLLQADGDRAWPIPDHVLAVVLASRVAHHLQRQHFVHEVFRVCRSGGHLLLGQVTRDANSLPSRLQRYKRTLLAERGLGAPAAAQVIQQIAETCLLRGANPLPPITVAQWTRTITARRLLALWQGKPQLSSRTRGNALNTEQQAAVLHTLTEWARSEFGGLDEPQEFSEAYILQGIRLP